MGKDLGTVDQGLEVGARPRGQYCDLNVLLRVDSTGRAV
jgi:hypothetical protein